MQAKDRWGCATWEQKLRPARARQANTGWLRLALLAWALWLALAAFAHAQEPGTAAITVLPTDGQTRGVQLRAQTIDVTIHEEAGVVWADTRIWINFQNTGQAPITAPITLSGPQLAPALLPADLRATLNNKPLQLTLLPARKDEPQIGATTIITVPAQGTAALRIDYRQALPVQDGLATFAYALTATARWSGKPESLRATVRFDPPIVPGQMLKHSPVETRRDRAGWTWHWENMKATQDIVLAFVAPSRWADLENARSRAAAEGGLAAHAALAERYWRLATQPPPGFQRAEHFERFFPSAVAALQAGLAHPGDASPADIAAAHARLAELYLFQTARLQHQDTDTYLQLAAAELAAALALNPADRPIRQEAADLQRQLLALARARGDALAVQEHQARLAALETPAGRPSPQALARSAALTLAEQAAAQGDITAAAQQVAATFGAEAIVRPERAPPHIQQALVSVASTATHRTITLQMIGQAESVDALLAQTAQALAGIAQVEVAAGRLTLTLPYAEAGQLLAAQARATEALPKTPELALLAAVLRPPRYAWQIESQPFVTVERYSETVDLAPAWAQWDAQARGWEETAAAARATEGTSDAARLARLQGAIWEQNAAAWRTLAERSRATYRVELGDQHIARTWEISAGGASQLSAEVRAWRYERLSWIAGGAALLLLMMVYAVWRATGRG